MDEIDLKKAPKGKEFLYVGHYIDTNGNYILKIGTTNNLHRRQREHENRYKNESKKYKMPENGAFVYDWFTPLSKYNTLRFEDRNREAWKEKGVGVFVRNDRFNCGKHKPKKVKVTIRKTYEIQL